MDSGNRPSAHSRDYLRYRGGDINFFRQCPALIVDIYTTRNLLAFLHKGMPDQFAEGLDSFLSCRGQIRKGRTLEVDDDMIHVPDVKIIRRHGHLFSNELAFP